MPRQKLIFPVREPSGKASRAAASDMKACSPGEVKRLRDAALAGMAAQEWGTELGRLFLAGKIGAPLFEAGKRFTVLLADYRVATGAPSPSAKAASYFRGGQSHPVDPDSEDGKKEAARHVKTVASMSEVHAVLIGAGKLPEHAVMSVCGYDEAPVGETGLIALNDGLLWIAKYWGLIVERK